MVCYIDFEANGASRVKEIISIGAVLEDGRTFYSLVRPHTKLDHKIKELTGISQEDAEKAPTIDEVIKSLWTLLIDDMPTKFYIYGHNDRGFVDASIDVAEEWTTKCSLTYLRDNMEDVSKRVAKKFHRDGIGLRSAYLTMRRPESEEAKQSHNALEDAEMLKYVWENIGDYELPAGEVPVVVPRMEMRYGKKGKRQNGNPALNTRAPKYMVQIKAWQDSKKGHREWVFDNVAGASGIVSFASNKKKRIKMMDRILEICEKGEGDINGKHFAFLQSK